MGVGADLIFHCPKMYPGSTPHILAATYSMTIRTETDEDGLSIFLSVSNYVEIQIGTKGTANLSSILETFKWTA